MICKRLFQNTILHSKNYSAAYTDWIYVLIKKSFVSCYLVHQPCYPFLSTPVYLFHSPCWTCWCSINNHCTIKIEIGTIFAVFLKGDLVLTICHHQCSVKLNHLRINIRIKEQKTFQHEVSNLLSPFSTNILIIKILIELEQTSNVDNKRENCRMHSV